MVYGNKPRYKNRAVHPLILRNKTFNLKRFKLKVYFFNEC